MLEELNEDFDETEANMVKVDTKMKELIAKSNQCCLWIILLIEFAILLVLFFITL